MSSNRPYVIAADFDGTIVEDKYPLMGEPRPAIVEYLKDQASRGALIILWTCRCGDELWAAAMECSRLGIPIHCVNENAECVKEEFGGDPRKIFADEYLDDRAIDVSLTGIEFVKNFA